MLTLGFELVEQYSREESAKPPRACSAVDGNTVTAAGDDDDVQDADDCAPSGSGCNNKLYPRGESSTMHLLAALVEVRDTRRAVATDGLASIFFSHLIRADLALCVCSSLLNVE